jgi:hypothetical protein
MAERPRDTRFALINVAFLADPKFGHLARSTSRAEFNAAVGVWLQLLCAARQSKSPVINWEDWADDTKEIGHLRQARLLNGQGFNMEPFETWGPKKTYPSDALRNTTQGYSQLHNPTRPSLSTPLSSSNGTYLEREVDTAESRVVVRSLTEEERQAAIEEQRKLLSHPHPAVAKAAKKAIDKLEAAR